MSEFSVSGYSMKVIEHFQRPRNAGLIENADGTGEIGDPDCGDFMRVYVKIEGDVVKDVKYQIKGCPASIACASAMTELAIGKNVYDAVLISDNDIVEALDGLPEIKQHCSNLSASALRIAISEHLERVIREKKSGSK